MSKEELKPVKLTAKERMMLIFLLQEQRGGVMELRVTQQLIDDLSFTEEEAAEYGAVMLETSAGVSAKWETTPGTRTFQFTAWRSKKIQSVLRDLDNRGGVTVHHLPLFDAFLPDGQREVGDPELKAELQAVGLLPADKDTEAAE